MSIVTTAPRGRDAEGEGGLTGARGETAVGGGRFTLKGP